MKKVDTYFKKMTYGSHT